MKKINIKDYTVEVVTQEGKKDIKYNVKDSIVTIMFHRDTKLNMVETIKYEEIAKKILAADEFIVLEDAEYDKIKRSFDTFVGYGRSEVELCKRILNPEDVKVETK